MQTLPTNLFTYATSELSFDAFVCWLAAWSAPECRTADSALHELAGKFVSSLLDKHGFTLPAGVVTVDVKRQYHGIDVLLIINEKYAVIIENKIRTKNHGDQLKRYSKRVSENLPKLIRVPIYLKIYDQSNYTEIQKNDYAPFTRHDLLNVLRGGSGVSNQIYVDFYDYLEAIENRVQSYLILPADQWRADQWTGFFQRLQAELEEGSWGYVANPSGGFYGFWWSFLKTPDLSAYLQIQHKVAIAKICIKINNKHPNTDSAVRNACFRFFRKKFADANLSFSKPARFGKGGTMTVLESDTDFRVFEQERLDFKQTLDQIKRVEAVFQTITCQDLEQIVA